LLLDFLYVHDTTQQEKTAGLSGARKGVHGWGGEEALFFEHVILSRQEQETESQERDVSPGADMLDDDREVPAETL